MVHNENDKKTIKDRRKDKDFTTIHLRINTDLLNEIDDFTDSYNFMNRTDAVRFLISSGLKNFDDEK